MVIFRSPSSAGLREGYADRTAEASGLGIESFPKRENVRFFATFKSTVQQVFASTPRQLRARTRHEGRREESGPVALGLPYRAPLDGAGLIAFLARRAVPGVEEVVGGAYRRALRLPHGAGVVELRPDQHHVRARFWLENLRDLAAAIQRSRALLDLDSDPQAVLEALGGHALLGGLVRAAPGRRVAGHVDGDELAVRAVLGQQVSLAAATTLAARLVAAHGTGLARPIGGVTHLFPTAGTLAETDPDRLAMPVARRRALLQLAAALARGELALDAGVEREQARQRLLSLPGIGPWTVEYIAMRALRDPDAFLPSDLGVRHALQRLGHGGGAPAAAALAERWRPYRAYATAHLWSSLDAGQSAASRRLAA